MAQKLNLPLPSADSLSSSLFPSPKQREDDIRGKVIDIPLTEIDPFPDHPFQVKQDEAMQTLTESVKAFRIQTPALVREKEDKRFELVSGHRRKLACELAGLETMPCIVRNLTREEAVIAMVDANLQRETILPSEKAKSYKMRLDAMKKQAGRPSKNYSPVGNNLSGKPSSSELAEAVGESKNQIFRYVRLNELIPQLLDIVDNSVIREKGKLQIAMRPAVELSYLPKAQQKALLEEMTANESTPSHEQAIKMRKFAEEGRLDENVIHSIMQETKPNQVEQFKIPRERISKYFAADTPTQKIEDTIIKALDMLRQRERTRSGEAR